MLAQVEALILGGWAAGEAVREVARREHVHPDGHAVWNSRVSGRTIQRWRAAYGGGIEALEPRSHRPSESSLALTEAVHDLEPMLRTILGESIEMTSTGTPDGGWVEIDPGQLEQVIVNLVVNARDAMPIGGEVTAGIGEITINEAQAQTSHVLHAGPYVQLAISDDGVGMDERTKSRVFESLFTTKEPDRGTGLGLATVCDAGRCRDDSPRRGQPSPPSARASRAPPPRLHRDRSRRW